MGKYGGVEAAECYPCVAERYLFKVVDQPGEDCHEVLREHCCSLEISIGHCTISRQSSKVSKSEVVRLVVKETLILTGMDRSDSELRRPSLNSY